MKTITIELDLEKLEERDLYSLCMGYALKDVLSQLIARSTGGSALQAAKEIDAKIDAYLVGLKAKHPYKLTTLKLQADQVKWLISDDSTVQKPPDVPSHL